MITSMLSEKKLEYEKELLTLDVSALNGNISITDYINRERILLYRINHLSNKLKEIIGDYTIAEGKVLNY